MSIFLTLAGIWLSGALIVSFARSCTLMQPCVATGPESFAVGVVIYHVLYLLLGFAGRDLPYWLPLLVGMLMGVLLSKGRLGKENGWVFRIRTFFSIERYAWVLLVLAICVMLSPILSLPLLDWDARILWAYKAKILAAEGIPSVDAFRDPYRLHIHPRYPLLVPWVSALLSKSQSGFQELHFRLVIFLFALLTLWQLYHLIRREAGWKLAFLLSLALMMTGSWMAGVANSSIEITLAFFGLLAVGRLLHWLENEESCDLWMAGIFLAGACMTKNEGLLIGVAVMSALLLTSFPPGKRNKRLKAVGMVALCMLLLTTPWFVQMSLLPPVSDENYLMRLHAESLRFGAERFFEICSAVTARMGDLRLWHVFWLVLPVWAGMALIRRDPKSQGLFLLVILALYCAGIMFIYLISPWRDITLQINVTFDRIMLPLLVLSFLLGGYGFPSVSRAP